jgi:hypothetical protein
MNETGPDAQYHGDTCGFSTLRKRYAVVMRRIELAG